MRIRIFWLKAILVVLTCYSCGLTAQTSFPKGVYLSWEELATKSPSTDHEDIVVTERSQGDMVLMGGNAFKVECESCKKRKIRKKWFAYSDGNHLYINCFPLGLENHFAQVIEEGYYMLFKAVPNSYDAAVAGLMFGVVGALAVSAATAHKWNFYLLDHGTGMVTQLDDEALQLILWIDKDLLNAYRQEEEKDAQKIAEYIKAANDAYNKQVSRLLETENVDRSDLTHFKVVDLVIYRARRKEVESPLKLTIADSISFEILPESYFRTKLIVYEKEAVEVCVNQGAPCISVDFNDHSSHFVRCSMTEKRPTGFLEIADESTYNWIYNLERKERNKKNKATE